MPVCGWTMTDEGADDVAECRGREEAQEIQLNLVHLNGGESVTD